MPGEFCPGVVLLFDVTGREIFILLNNYSFMKITGWIQDEPKVLYIFTESDLDACNDFNKSDFKVKHRHIPV